MKEYIQHIWTGDSKTLCGRSMWQVIVLPTHISEVPLVSFERHNNPFNQRWCKICKMKYNSDIVSCHPDEILK